jgi:GT2 family glycosyltransferase
MVKKATFDAVNGFDTAFNAAYIDVDFCIRLKSQKAMKSHYLASSVARHQGVNSDEAANDSDDNYKSDAISKGMGMLALAEVRLGFDTIVVHRSHNVHE